MEKVIITVVGHDTVGIIAKVCTYLSNIKVNVEDKEKTLMMFDILLGDNLQARKDFIAENGHLYLDMTDVS